MSRPHGAWLCFLSWTLVQVLSVCNEPHLCSGASQSAIWFSATKTAPNRRVFLLDLKRWLTQPFKPKNLCSGGSLKIQEEQWGGRVLPLWPPIRGAYAPISWWSSHPTARTMEGQARVLQLWSGWSVMGQFSQGWVAEEKNLLSHSYPHHIISVRRSGLLSQFPCAELRFLPLNSPCPSLSQGWLPLDLLLDIGWGCAVTEPQSWGAFCCLDSCYHSPHPRHWHLLPPRLSLPCRLGITTCIFQPSDMPPFCQIRVFLWSPQISMTENPAASLSLPLPTCPR